MSTGLFSIPASSDTVVVVDDDEAVLRMVGRALRAKGVACEVAREASQALEQVRTLQPGAVLADYQMPDIDGVVVLRRVGELSPASVRVLMTAHADERVLARALNEAHAEFYLPKPFDTAQLRDVVAAALQRGRRTRRWRQAMFDASLDGQLLASNDGTIRQVNPALCQMFGYSADTLRGRPLDTLLPPAGRHECGTMLAGSWHGGDPEVRIKRRLDARHARGHAFPIELGLVSIDDPVQGHSLAITVRDLTRELRQERAVAEANAALAKANKELKRLARTDRLTGLANRRWFDETFQAELHRSLRSGQCFALALCDVDYFKGLNDELGHQEGDAYLIEVAHVLEHAFRRSGELVARWGGEEFALLVPHVTTLKEARGVGERVLTAVRAARLTRPRCPTGEQLSVSVGVVFGEPGTWTADEFFRLADKALYLAKQGGRDRACLAPPASSPSPQSRLVHYL